MVSAKRSHFMADFPHLFVTACGNPTLTRCAEQQRSIDATSRGSATPPSTSRRPLTSRCLAQATALSNVESWKIHLYGWCSHAPLIFSSHVWWSPQGFSSYPGFMIFFAWHWGGVVWHRLVWEYHSGDEEMINRCKSEWSWHVLANCKVEPPIGLQRIMGHIGILKQQYSGSIADIGALWLQSCFV